MSNDTYIYKKKENGGWFRKRSTATTAAARCIYRKKVKRFKAHISGCWRRPADSSNTPLHPQIRRKCVVLYSFSM